MRLSRAQDPGGVWPRRRPGRAVAAPTAEGASAEGGPGAAVLERLQASPAEESTCLEMFYDAACTKVVQAPGMGRGTGRGPSPRQEGSSTAFHLSPSVHHQTAPSAKLLGFLFFFFLFF